ncbi:MAG: DUF933 domain-containing protein [Candidatus Omnitrophota bacterium]|jgi:ribosome-binding ATPase YchF (GTP1/OBG family)
MKISIFSLPDIKLGKHNVKDSRLDEVDNISRAKKKTYVQVEVAAEDAILDADCILAPQDARQDLVLKDLEFIETRLGRSEDANEKGLLEKLKAALEKEQFVAEVPLAAEEKQLLSGYGLCTKKPVVLAEKEEPADLNQLLVRCLQAANYISFFTTGEKETRAWLIKKGTTAWEAAGSIHSDIQRGFIRAEIISFQDFIGSGGENPAKQAGKLRLEQKDYVMQDADLTTFRFNK